MIASSANTNLYFIEEDSNGDILAVTPEFTPLRFNTHSLAKSSERIASEENLSGRHKSADRRGTDSVAGDIACQLSFGSHDALIEAAFCGAWSANVLKTGDTRRTFSIIEHHTDLDIYYRYSGCEFNTLGLEAPMSEKVTLTFGVVGKDMVEYTMPGDQTFAAVTTTDFITTLNGSLTIDAVTIGYATTFSISLANGIEPKYSLFNSSAIDSTIDVVSAEGKVSAYFESSVLMDKYIDDDESIMITAFTDGTDTYTLTVPKASYLTGGKSASGNDIVVDMDFSAGYDTGEGTEFKLERT